MTTLGTDVYACVSVGGIYKQTPTKALEVYSTAETLTNQMYLGYPVYRKVINFGALPNSTTKSVAHNISGTFTVIKLESICYSSTKSNPIYPSFGGYVDLFVSGGNITIITNVSLVVYTSSYVTIEYVKAAL